ncbi:phage resistance protein [Pseudomonas putida]|uniref:cyclic-guanylate-specific phosphodiesterase n=3 Tax=Pseudomonadaceae TaxID=135621 RepID=A0AAX0VR39_9PSED|nr:MULTISPECIES: EAL domain-containing protein [Pseudomonas]MDM9593914.1 EAL domain-containing protein [Pseudomonas guariconensis]MDM9606741.1 EAL domain-containing protein [Pseudomonas guariconensis]MDM9611697.1 EAL domain-containing protein [Pseudomonas guariconensis]MEB3843781.1 EAL domain-containing protein [Pseudomonas guariconensis]MEB3876649.1 EAL domain-containing protein [Pseudomonas guariconensis]
MPFKVKRSARRGWRVLLPWAVGALPLLCGLAIMHWQAQRELQNTSQATTRQVVEQVEHILDNISNAAKELLPLVGRPCDEIDLALRSQVTRNAFVRSTNLFHNNTLYCSSLFGNFDEPVDAQDYTDGRLWLMSGNSVTPNHPLLAYRASNAGSGAIATVDGDHLTSALQWVSSGEELQLQVGDHWMGKDGVVHKGTPPAAAIAPSVQASIRYPFSVHGGYGTGKKVQFVSEHYPALLSLLLLLGVLAGIVCHWQIRRASSPRAELSRALEADEFLPYFQPVVRKDDYRWAGVEVLMRWDHPREGLVRPDLFIPYAEHSGLIVPMTRALMLRTAQALAPYAALLEDGFHIGINITADHCRDLELLDDCRTFLQHFPPGRVVLTLELTERKLIEATPITLELFEKLHDMGVMIALDDFGTGQSSLNYLRQFKVDYLKIDQSFVAMIGGDALSQHILDTIIELSGKLGLGIVAEGVETEVQRDYLARHQVGFQQGYLFGRPMPVDDFLQALAARPGSSRLPHSIRPEIMPN